MAVVEVVKYDGSDDLYAWKHPSSELGNWTQLIVNESQEAILFRGGQALDLFTAGRHTLSTENIPLLSKLINLPFGNKSPFAAEVWFINKKYSIDIKWGTRKPIQLQDPKYNIFVSVRAFGQFGVRIEDSRKFLIKLVGTLKEFSRPTLVEYFRGFMMTKIKDHISSYLVHKKISILDINAYIYEISEYITERIRPYFSEFGIELLNFYVNSINFPEDDPGVARLKNALSQRAEMEIVGFNYQQQRSFDALEAAAKNEGGDQSSMMGAGMGLGMGVGVGGAFGNAMSGMAGNMQLNQEKACPKCHAKNYEHARFCISCGHHYNQTTKPETNEASEASCSKCSTVIKEGYKFCPKCGDPYNPCPQCGEDNDSDSKSCRKCAYVMPTPCPSCSKPVQAGMRFCSECGHSLQKKCVNCQHDIQPNQRFCPECGHSQNEVK